VVSPTLHLHHSFTVTPPALAGVSYIMVSFPYRSYVDFPQAAALQELLQHGFVPQNVVFLGTSYASTGAINRQLLLYKLLTGYSSDQEFALVWAPAL